MPLISLVDQITHNIEQNLYTMVMLLDFKKAFDSVDHLILLNKLNHYGIRGQALNLIKNYLMNRRQQVVYNGVISQVQTITTGVPQGSILGPLFFLVYINDLPKISPSTDFLIFADDTTSIESNKNIETLFHTANDTVRKLDHWCSVNKIALNKQKTKYLLYYPRKTPENKKKELQKKLNIKICGVQIEEVTSAKFLGVIIDNSLTWKPHIELLTTKISQVIGILYKTRYKINTKAALCIYDALISSHLSYCNIVWGNTYPTVLHRIHILQKKH